MAKMLDILEKFMNLHGYTYVRLDGNTRVEQRQRVVERFNRDERVFCFISSTRSGGLGLNLTGADTVIFYDTDWNPSMDKQAQDRCHRIGQTHTVHIYRLITSYTIEENILRKSLQKRKLEDMILEEGEFTTEFYEKVKVRELLEVQDETLETALRAVEDDEDFTALKAAQKEEQQVSQELCEMEDTGEAGLLARFDAVTQRAVQIWQTLNPDMDQPISQESEDMSSSADEEAASCDEDFRATPCQDSEQVFKAKRDFLRGKYIVY
jgi:superfamily II DNA/RNA helicase